MQSLANSAVANNARSKEPRVKTNMFWREALFIMMNYELCFRAKTCINISWALVI